MTRLFGSPVLRSPLFRSPLLHFLLIGGALFVASRQLGDEAPGTAVYDIRISKSDIATLRNDWRRQAGREPEARELRALIEARIDDELLLAAAREMGWHQSDAVIQRRLIQNQRFLDPQTEESDAELLRRARQQGMESSDIVVRRRLLERMKLWIVSDARSAPPSEAQLERHLDRRAEKFRRPERVRLSQIYLSRDRRGEALADDATRLAAVLERDATPPADAARHSDPFLLANDLPLSSREEIGRRFGPAFAEGAMAAPDGGWTGPIASSYGLHFVWIRERVAGGRRPLAEVRSAVLADWMRQREQEMMRERLSELRSVARIEIADAEGEGEGEAEGKAGNGG